MLGIADFQSARGELFDAKRASEEATTVLRQLKMNEPCISQVRCLKSHKVSVELRLYRKYPKQLPLHGCSATRTKKRGGIRIKHCLALAGQRRCRTMYLPCYYFLLLFTRAQVNV